MSQESWLVHNVYSLSAQVYDNHVYFVQLPTFGGGICQNN